MKFKKFGVFYTLIFALIVLALASGGCGGSSSSRDGVNPNSSLSNGDYSQVLVLTSKVFTDAETYTFYKGGKLYNGATEYTNQYYVASVDSSKTAMTIKLGLYESLSNDVLTVKDSNNNIVYAYNPAGATATTANYPDSLTLGGNYKALKYNSLSFGTLKSSGVEEGVVEFKDYADGEAFEEGNNNNQPEMPSMPEMPAMQTLSTVSTAENSSYKTAADTVAITLSGTTASIGGTAIKEYDYVWHASPSVSVDYYTNGLSGTTKMSESEVLSAIAAANDAVYNNYGVYIARDVHYMPNGLTFNKTVKNDNETEYACYYDSSVVTEAQAANPSVTYSGNMIFATMPTANASSTMSFSASAAYANPVLHITKPGTYNLSGSWTGQIWIDAGDDDDSSAKVTLILNGVTVTCSVAPAIVFHDLYECETGDESSIASGNSFLTLGTSSGTVTSSNAGAVVQLASGTTNNFTGANVYRILSINPKSGITTIDGTDIDMQKKRWKMDAAFYSFVSLVIEGSGTLNVTSTTYEGLDTEMHLSINGGTVNVNAPDDGMNTNEDEMSVFTMNGGTLTVSSTGGDGIDSNGYIVINGGTLTAKSGGGADHGMDADMGVYIKSSGATVYADSIENHKTNISGYTGTYSTVNGNGNSGTPGDGGTPPDQSGETPPDQSGETPPDQSGGNTGTSTGSAVPIDSSGSTLTVNASVSTLTPDSKTTSARIADGVSTSGTNFKLSGVVNTFSGVVTQ